MADAQYYLDSANNREEYDEARRVFDEIEGRLQPLKEKRDAADVIVKSLEDEIDGLKSTYDTEKQARETQRTFIIDNAKIEVEEYDPTTGDAPPLPEEADATSTDDTGDSSSGTTTSPPS